MGAELGAERLVAAAERFGFNEDPGLAGAMRSTIPAAAEIGDDLAVGSTAIGQGKVLATPLLMAGDRRRDRRGRHARPADAAQGRRAAAHAGRARAGRPHDRAVHARGGHVRDRRRAPRSPA